MNIQIFGTKKSFDSKKAERYFKERGIKFHDRFLTESSKSPASIARSNKQWVGLTCIRRGTSPS